MFKFEFIFTHILERTIDNTVTGPVCAMYMASEHSILGTQLIHIGVDPLANDFCRSCREEEIEKTLHHLLGTGPTIYRMGKKL